MFARARSAALEITSYGEPVVAPVDRAALQRRLGGLVDFRKTSLQRDEIIAAVGRRIEVKFHHLGESVGHLGFGDKVAAPELDAINAKVTRCHVEQPLAKKI